MTERALPNRVTCHSGKNTRSLRASFHHLLLKALEAADVIWLLDEDALDQCIKLGVGNLAIGLICQLYYLLFLRDYCIKKAQVE